ncbi:methyltransferase domain-containing protein [Actinomarinicola tropica]|uniref:Methyltransferase domain-containing protein n=1 Tax=Actinomarinicola tropica TaxID=2789776 RepID=A0A5Q2RVB6_9ACTN|nr:methyltransferase domain-containing protein [Actinomarinicola tropica]
MVTNHANWEARVPLHAASRDYGLDRYAAEPERLSDVVRFDLPRLGDVDGLDVVHLQCHIGTDTLSLARLGASVTGLDFSGSALEVARDLFATCETPGEFVESTVDDAVVALGSERFDLVYTGVGAISWLPSIDRWAEVVAGLLRPGGRLFIRDMHPMLFTLDESRDDDLLCVRFHYFESPGGERFESEVTYVDHEGTLSSPEEVSFNHGIGEMLTAVLDHGMTIDAFVEHDTCPWQALPQMVETESNEWALPDGRERVPMTFTLGATKR